MIEEHHVVNAPFTEESKFSEQRVLYQKYLEKYYNSENSFDFFEASEDIPVSLKEIYVPLRLAKEEINIINNSEEVEEIEGDEVYSFLNKYPYVALSGVAGSGKSTLTKYLASSLSASKISQEHYNLGRRVVFPIILRELDFSKINTFAQLTHQWLLTFSKKIDFQIDLDFFNYYLENGWAIVLFDGFDELESSMSQKVITWIKKWIRWINKRETKTKTNVIITARPTGFEHVNFAEGLFEKLYIQPFNQKQIEIFSQKFFRIRYGYDKPLQALKHKAFLEKLENFTGLAELKHRPIYLAMLGFISETDGEIPDTRALAYEKITEAYVFLLDQKKRLGRSIMPSWTKSDKIAFLSEFAYMLHHYASKGECKEKKQLHIYISKQEMHNIFENILKTSSFASIDKDTNIEEITEYFLARTGLLVEPKEGFVQFSHLSFQEYLVAKRIHRKQKKRNIESYLKKEIFDHLDKVGWEEIAQLYFGIDGIRQDEGQEEILHFLIDPHKASHCKFLYNFLLNSTNKLTKEEREAWFHTLIYMLLSLENLYELRSLVEEFENNVNRIDIDLLPFVKQMFLSILDKKENLNGVIGYVDEDDEEDLFYKLEGLSKKQEIRLKNILYLGFYFKGFKENYLDDMLIDKILMQKKNIDYAILLDKYIPFNTKVKVALSNKVLKNVTLLEFMFLHDQHIGLLYASVYGDLELNQKLMQLNLNIFKKSFFLKIFFSKEVTMAMIRARAIDMTLDEATISDMTIDKKYISGITMFRDVTIDMIIDISMTTKDIDMTRSMAMDILMRIDRDIAMDMLAMDMTMDKKLYEKFLLFNLYGWTKLFSEEADIEVNMSKRNLEDVLKNPLSFFKDISLSEQEKIELDEVLDKSPILPMLKFILENTDYENFDEKDEEKALELFHQDIIAFNEKHK